MASDPQSLLTQRPAKTRRAQLLDGLQIFIQHAKSTVRSCIFTGIGPFPDPEKRDKASVALEHVIVQRLSSTGWILCIDGNALHLARGKEVAKNLGWINSFAYSCHRRNIKKHITHNGLFVQLD